MQINQYATKEELAHIIEQNMGLVASIVKHFKPRNKEEYDEFIHIGRIGLWKAAKKYDPSRSQFSTAAWYYIKFEILRHIQQRNKNQPDQIVNETLVKSRENKTNIWELLPDCLSKEERKVIDLRLCGYTFLDIGNKMGFSGGWANNIYHSALQKIREANEEKTNFMV